jgi:hypothetical protein
MNVIFDPCVNDFLGMYFENYIGYDGHNDLYKRTLRIRRIREFLSSFDISETYIANGKRYVKIPDIAIIEYVARKNQTEILVENIFFVD